MTENQIIELAAKEGAKVALETYWKQQELEEKNISDTRLRNVKLLLKHYRSIKAHALKAVYETEMMFKVKTDFYESKVYRYEQ